MDIKKFKNIWNQSIDNAIKNIEEGKHLSKFKIKPVPPKEFFEVWLKQPLFPMQYEVINQVFTNNYMDWNTDIHEILLLWGEGCISKDTMIKDVITHEQHTVSQWCQLKKRFHVLAYDFETTSWKVVLADIPFKKGRAKIYKVVVRDPNQKKYHTIKCTEEHKFYTPHGWKELKDLKVGDLVATYNPPAALVSTWNASERKKKLGEIDLPKNDSHLIFKPIEKIEYVGEDDYYDFNVPIYHNYLLHGILHHNSGKDYTIVRTLVYVCYWLCCLNNPQEYFRIGKDTPIVIANMSVNEDHAKDVFFSQFTTCLKSVTNPSTGRNFFEELGVDLREGKDIQTRKVKLPNYIEAYALDSSKYAGEGKNTLFVVFDEIAEFRFDKAKQRYENLKNTAFSRFPNFYKVVMLSYPRDEFDFMMVHLKETEEWPEELKNSVYKKIAAPWEVRSKENAHPILIEKRLYKTREDYTPLYRVDPIDSMRRYECKFPKIGANRFLKQFDLVLDRCVNFERPSPFVWESIGREKQIYLTDKELNAVTLQPWFKNSYTYEIYQLEQKLFQDPTNEKLKRLLDVELQKHENSQYFIHIDLSRGIKDCAGLAMIHPYYISSSIVGYYVDLVIQIRPEETEIDFESIRNFIFKLNDKGFDIAKVTLDGFQSADFCQIVRKRGIESEIISVDRSRKPYDTFKSLLYQGKVNTYGYLVLLRELKELIVEKNGKVDHPKESQQRLKEEGIKDGSKDCSDAVCGAIYSAVMQESEFGPTIVDETDIDSPNLDDIL